MNPANIINILNIAALMCMMFATGLQVKWEDVLSSAKEKGLLFSGFLANYLIVPAVAFALLYLFKSEASVAAGFLVLAVCPAAPVGPPLTAVARGNVPIAVTLMLLLASLSALLSPTLLIWLYGGLFPGTVLEVDYFSILKTLLLAQLIPLIAGLCVSRYLPAKAKLIALPLDKFSKLFFFLVLIAVLSTQYKVFATVHLKGWFGMLVLLFASFGIGWICGGKQTSVKKAFALTTATRNGGVGLVIVLANFAGTSAVAAVVVYTVLSVFGSLAFSLILRANDTQQSAA